VKDTRAATSAIGIILLVAITVLLAGVVTVFAFAEGNQVNEPAPEAVFDVETCASCQSLADPGPDSTTNFINITYTQGEHLQASQVQVKLDGELIFDPSKTGRAAYAEPANYDGAGNNDLRWSSDTLVAGEQLVLEDDADADAGSNEFQSGETLHVVWTAPNSGDAYVLVEVELNL
jgi:FlaG/FlaF family flagellin (archaellin)